MSPLFFLNRRGLLGALVAGVLALSVPAMGQSLDDARAQGLVVETASGYVEARSDDPAIRQLVQTVNRQRAEHYQSVASREGVSQSAVERLAGERLLAEHPPR